MNNDVWDDNELPLAYLITIRTYGTWLHGDERKSVDRHGKNIYGTPKVLSSRNLIKMMDDSRGSDIFTLNGPQRAVVDSAIRAVCKFRGYELFALNIRTNHGHSVVNANLAPEKIINAFKANATREIRSAKLVDESQQVWSRGGSRRYLWKPAQVERAIDYVINWQGDDLPDF